VNCLEFKEKIFAYLDNELEADAARQFRAHMAGCTSCREEVRQYELLQNAVHDMPERECPEELSQKIRAAIEAERNKQKVIPLYKKPWMRTIAAAAAFVIFVGAGSVIFENIFAANSAAPESQKSNITSDYDIMADSDLVEQEVVSSSATGLFSTAYSYTADEVTSAAPEIAEPENKKDNAAVNESLMSSPPQEKPDAPTSDEQKNSLPANAADTPVSPQSPSELDVPMPQAPAQTVPASTKEELERAKAVANVRLQVSDTKQACQELAEIAKNLECAAEINADGLFCIELELLDYDAAYKAICEMKSLEEIEKFISKDKIGEMEYTVLRIWCE